MLLLKKCLNSINISKNEKPSFAILLIRMPDLERL